MKKELIVNGLKFHFRNSTDNKDGYFEYVDTANPTGVRRLPFSLNIEASEFKFHAMKFVDGETGPATDEYIEIVKAAIEANIVEGAVITGLRFYYRHAKKLRASSLRIYVDRHEGVQYHFVADRASYSKYIDKEGNVQIPGRAQPIESAKKKPAPVKQGKPADPAKLEQLAERFNQKHEHTEKVAVGA